MPPDGNRQARRIYRDLGACEECGKPAEHRHHKDENTENNARSNVAFLCSRCHSAAHGVLRLSEESVGELRRRYALGESAKALAREFGITETPARRAIFGTGWTDVEADPPAARPTNAIKTRCRHGHEFTTENTIIKDGGHREWGRAARGEAVTVAALYVDPKGVYADLPDVEVWDEARDARLYDGPWPVVAHPPCARWSRLAGFTEARFGLTRGEDGGCFLAALQAVRQWGGVIEHPAYSAAWAAFGLPKPIHYGGWTHHLLDAGASCYVEQGRYGLPVKKATWLYAYGVELPELRWGFTPDGQGDPENQNEHGGIDGWRDAWARVGRLGEDTFWSRQRNSGRRASTPPAFRDVLLAMARSASRELAGVAPPEEQP